jgi:formylglycine-generating enzyme required for sulfatase activity
MEGLHKNKQTGVDATSLLFWKIIEFESPKLVEEAKENSEIFNILIEISGDISVKDPNTGSWEIPADKIQAIPQKSLQPYLEDRRLVEFIRNIKIPAEQVRQLISLSSIVKSTETAQEEDKRIRQKLERRTDYKLGEMVEIPDGDFLYGDEKETVNIAETFEIDIYPVTNSQFEHFIKEGGYEKEEYWDKEGWAWRQKKNITQPRYCNEKKLNQPEHPVVGVTYYEAKAYARWAGKDLPTEQQWERAARGTDGREYPWGDKFDATKCNSAESGILRTSKVTRYPNGISPAGCYDMAGNVSEWTNSIYNESKGPVVLRGGSWDLRGDYCRCADRDRNFPLLRYFNVGFRCARTLTL